MPPGKSRRVNCALFEVEPDPALDFLLGPSPWPRRRNPQTTVELRDVPGAAALISGSSRPEHGVVQLGQFKLSVNRAGAAELYAPAGATVTVKTAI